VKYDLLIIRIGFVLLLALGGYLLTPLARSSHFADFVGDAVRTKQILSAVFGALIGAVIIAFEIRARQASLKTLIGAAFGSILGIVGAYLIGMLISTQDINTVPGRAENFPDHCSCIFYGLHRPDGRCG
jgi:hypothetical protein